MPKFQRGDYVILARHHKVHGDYGIYRGEFRTGRPWMIQRLVDTYWGEDVYDIGDVEGHTAWTVLESMLDLASPFQRDVLTYIRRELSA